MSGLAVSDFRSGIWPDFHGAAPQAIHSRDRKGTGDDIEG